MPFVSSVLKVGMQNIVKLRGLYVNFLRANSNDWPITLVQFGDLEGVLSFLHNIVVELVPEVKSSAPERSRTLTKRRHCQRRGSDQNVAAASLGPGNFLSGLKNSR